MPTDNVARRPCCALRRLAQTIPGTEEPGVPSDPPAGPTYVARLHELQVAYATFMFHDAKLADQLRAFSTWACGHLTTLAGEEMATVAPAG
ncbi:MAG: hypothetical protein QM679_12545 [Patulibacter sp.]